MQNMYKKISISSVISFIVTIGVMTFGLIGINASIDIIEENKRVDLKTIYFHELEHRTIEIKQVLDRIVSQSTYIGKYNELTNTIIIGDELIQKVVKNMRITNKGMMGNARYVISIYFDNYYTLVQVSPGIYDLYRIDPNFMFEIISVDNQDAIIYVLNHSGQLLYANSEKIKANEVSQRQLVQKFIWSTLNKGQYELGNSGRILGFFTYINDTNLILFAEISPKSIARVVDDIKYRLYLYAVIIMIICVFLIGFWVHLALKPLHRLLLEMNKLAKGNYNIKLKTNQFGELGILFSTFKNMAQSLYYREQEILQLSEEKRKKEQLSRELEIASEIQNHLIQKSVKDISSNIDISSEYIPASKVAGDWFSYKYFFESKKFVAIVADVAGHGAGSGLLTGVISGIYQAYIQKNVFNSYEFLLQANKAIHDLLHGNEHATIQIVEIDELKRKCTIYNLGHTWPYLTQKANGLINCQKISLPSDVGGLSDDPKISQKTFSIENDISILIYTDGLIEAQGLPIKPLKSKDIQKLLMETLTDSADEIIHKIKRKWQEKMSGFDATDDICLVCLKLKN